MSDELHRLITENMTDLVTVIDASGVLTYASPSYRGTLGFEPEEMVGQSMFEGIHPKIMAREGCRRLELWNDVNDENVFFTHSEWDSLEHLEQYRTSELFKTTWKRTRTFFSEPAQAWSVVRHT